MRLGRAVLIWLCLVPVAIANGAFRTFLLLPVFGDRPAHIISSLMLSALIVAIARAALRPDSLLQAWRTGLFWLTLTVLFEFVAGHWLFGQPWEKLLADYNVLNGRVWILVLIATLTAPVVAYMTRKSANQGPDGP